MTPSLRQQVCKFREAMGLPVNHTPRVLTDDQVRLHASLIAEEFVETMGALFDLAKDDASAVRGSWPFLTMLLKEILETAPVRVDMVELADGLADLDYVVESCRLEFGIYGAPIAAEVHRANMAKVGGPVREDGKVLKPLGWTPPDIVGVLRDQGWGTHEALQRERVAAAMEHQLRENEDLLARLSRGEDEAKEPEDANKKGTKG